MKAATFQEASIAPNTTKTKFQPIQVLPSPLMTNHISQPLTLLKTLSTLRLNLPRKKARRIKIREVALVRGLLFSIVFSKLSLTSSKFSIMKNSQNIIVQK